MPLKYANTEASTQHLVFQTESVGQEVHIPFDKIACAFGSDHGGVVIRLSEKAAHGIERIYVDNLDLNELRTAFPEGSFLDILADADADRCEEEVQSYLVMKDAILSVREEEGAIMLINLRDEINEFNGGEFSLTPVQLGQEVIAYFQENFTKELGSNGWKIPSLESA